MTGSYLSSSDRFAGAARYLHISRNEAKYTGFTDSYIFQLMAIEIPQCVQCKSPILPYHCDNCVVTIFLIPH